MAARSRRLVLPPRAGERDGLTRLPADLWARLLEDEESVARYRSKVYNGGPGRCAFYLGSLSSSGHGRFRAGTRAADASRPASIVVVAHVYGYFLSRGLPAGEPEHWPSILHRCDEPLCQAAGHLTAGSPAENSQQFMARRSDPFSPLRDTRGARGRAVAIRDAIRSALAAGASPGEVEQAIRASSSAGLPGAQGALF